MPVHHFVADRHLVERGLTNYWGYNTLGFFAPDVRYATGGFGRQVTETRTAGRCSPSPARCSASCAATPCFVGGAFSAAVPTDRTPRRTSPGCARTGKR
jgi:hypothetical protein